MKKFHRVKEIKVILDDDTDVSFTPKHPTSIKIIKGITERQDPLNMMFMEKFPNGQEALIIVSAPEVIKNFLLENNTEMIEKLLNT